MRTLTVFDEQIVKSSLLNPVSMLGESATKAEALEALTQYRRINNVSGGVARRLYDELYWYTLWDLSRFIAIAPILASTPNKTFNSPIRPNDGTKIENVIDEQQSLEQALKRFTEDRCLTLCVQTKDGYAQLHLKDLLQYLFKADSTLFAFEIESLVRNDDSLIVLGGEEAPEEPAELPAEQRPYPERDIVSLLELPDFNRYAATLVWMHRRRVRYAAHVNTEGKILAVTSLGRVVTSLYEKVSEASKVLPYAKRNPPVVRLDESVETALNTLLGRSLMWAPVVDPEGCFKGYLDAIELSSFLFESLQK